MGIQPIYHMARFGCYILGYIIVQRQTLVKSLHSARQNRYSRWYSFNSRAQSLKHSLVYRATIFPWFIPDFNGWDEVFLVHEVFRKCISVCISLLFWIFPGLIRKSCFIEGNGGIDSETCFLPFNVFSIPVHPMRSGGLSIFRTMIKVSSLLRVFNIPIDAVIISCQISNLIE